MYLFKRKVPYHQIALVNSVMNFKTLTDMPFSLKVYVTEAMIYLTPTFDMQIIFHIIIHII